MINKINRLFVFLILFIHLQSFSQERQNAETLPADFSEKAFRHIEYLSGLGHRHIGTDNDKKTIKYIKNQLEEIKINVEIQPFEIKSFEYTKANLEIEGNKYEILGLGLDPYKEKRNFEGKAFILDGNNQAVSFKPQDTAVKTIITNNINNHFRLLRYRPELIIYLDSASFEKLRLKSEANFHIEIEGEFKKYKSANIIGKIGNNKTSEKEILITAHFDTYRKNNPGASDNASGVSVLLEVARYFKNIENELNCTLKFIAFGAEEEGMAGSRNYLLSNTESLKNCELVFNIDNVGGSEAVYIETEGGVNGISSTKGISQIPENIKNDSWEGISSNWRMLIDNDLRKSLSATNHPEWLVEIIKKSVDTLGLQMRTAENMGSDQMVFAQAGIVASGISIRNPNSHSPKDIPDIINKNSLKTAGEIIAQVILRMLKRLE